MPLSVPHLDVPDDANSERVGEERQERSVVVVHGAALQERLEPLRDTVVGPRFHAHDRRWLRVLAEGLGHEPYLLECRGTRGEVHGSLPLCLVASPFFGRFLVGLPYLNTGGVHAENGDVARLLIDRAAELAADLRSRHLELRHEHESRHPSLTERLTTKVHMRLALPPDVDTLWSTLRAKVRNQVRKGRSEGFEVAWGTTDLLEDFYAVLARNMRDLGTPVYGRSLFRAVLDWFGSAAELCVVRDGPRPVAAALLVHGNGVTEVPTASSLREFNRRNPNMLMYWHLLERAVERGQEVFDFGRSTIDGPTHRFKKQWGAEPDPAVWQFHVRKGTVGEMRPDGGHFGLAIRVWQKLPLWIANRLGPVIVRGIP